jgi:hypothetical protein
MGRTIRNNPSAQVPSEPRPRSPISNAGDVGRTFPARALDPEVVTEEDLDETAGDQFRRADAQIQWLPDTPSGPAPVSIRVAVTNDVDVVNQFTRVTECRVNIDGGSAGNKRIRQGGAISPVDGYLDVVLTNGEAELFVEATSPGTVDLSIIDIAGSGLDVTDTAQATVV